jgi:creatinine amidohydrolase
MRISGEMKHLFSISRAGDMNASVRKFMELAWPEIKEFDPDNAAALIPIGQIVQHGPHLPVGTDVYQAEGITESVASELTRRGLETIVAPTIAFGNSPAQEVFPGYLNLRPEVLADQIEDVASCLARQGLRKQAYILFGPGSSGSLQIVAARLARSGTAGLIIIDGLQTARAVSKDLLAGHDPAAHKFDVHAGELETSLMLALRPDLVRMDKAVDHYSELHALFANCACTTGPLLQQMAAVGLRDWSHFGQDGVTGSATLATAGKGHEMVSRVVSELADHFGKYLFGRKND